MCVFRHVLHHVDDVTLVDQVVQGEIIFQRERINCELAARYRLAIHRGGERHRVAYPCWRLWYPDFFVHKDVRGLDPGDVPVKRHRPRKLFPLGVKAEILDLVVVRY